MPKRKATIKRNCRKKFINSVSELSSSINVSQCNGEDTTHDIANILYENHGSSSPETLTYSGYNQNDGWHAEIDCLDETPGKCLQNIDLEIFSKSAEISLQTLNVSFSSERDLVSKQGMFFNSQNNDTSNSPFADIHQILWENFPIDNKENSVHKIERSFENGEKQNNTDSVSQELPDNDVLYSTLEHKDNSSYKGFQLAGSKVDVKSKESSLHRIKCLFHHEEEQNNTDSVSQELPDNDVLYSTLEHKDNSSYKGFQLAGSKVDVKPKESSLHKIKCLFHHEEEQNNTDSGSQEFPHNDVSYSTFENKGKSSYKGFQLAGSKVDVKSKESSLHKIKCLFHHEEEQNNTDSVSQELPDNDVLYSTLEHKDNSSYKGFQLAGSKVDVKPKESSLHKIKCLFHHEEEQNNTDSGSQEFPHNDVSYSTFENKDNSSYKGFQLAGSKVDVKPKESSLHKIKCLFHHEEKQSNQDNTCVIYQSEKYSIEKYKENTNGCSQYTEFPYLNRFEDSDETLKQNQVICNKEDIEVQESRHFVPVCFLERYKQNNVNSSLFYELGMQTRLYNSNSLFPPALHERQHHKASLHQFLTTDTVDEDLGNITKRVLSQQCPTIDKLDKYSTTHNLIRCKNNEQIKHTITSRLHNRYNASKEKDNMTSRTSITARDTFQDTFDNVSQCIVEPVVEKSLISTENKRFRVMSNFDKTQDIINQQFKKPCHQILEKPKIYQSCQNSNDNNTLLNKVIKKEIEYNELSCIGTYAAYKKNDTSPIVKTNMCKLGCANETLSSMPVYINRALPQLACDLSKCSNKKFIVNMKRHKGTKMKELFIHEILNSVFVHSTPLRRNLTIDIKYILYENGVLFERSNKENTSLLYQKPIGLEHLMAHYNFTPICISNIWNNLINILSSSMFGFSLKIQSWNQYRLINLHTLYNIIDAKLKNNVPMRFFSIQMFLTKFFFFIHSIRQNFLTKAKENILNKDNLSIVVVLKRLIHRISILYPESVNEDNIQRLGSNYQFEYKTFLYKESVLKDISQDLKNSTIPMQLMIIGRLTEPLDSHIVFNAFKQDSCHLKTSTFQHRFPHVSTISFFSVTDGKHIAALGLLNHTSKQHTVMSSGRIIRVINLIKCTPLVQTITITVPFNFLDWKHYDCCLLAEEGSILVSSCLVIDGVPKLGMLNKSPVTRIEGNTVYNIASVCHVWYTVAVKHYKQRVLKIPLLQGIIIHQFPQCVRIISGNNRLLLEESELTLYYSGLENPEKIKSIPETALVIVDPVYIGHVIDQLKELYQIILLSQKTTINKDKIVDIYTLVNKLFSNSALLILQKISLDKNVSIGTSILISNVIIPEKQWEINQNKQCSKMINQHRPILIRGTQRSQCHTGSNGVVSQLWKNMIKQYQSLSELINQSPNIVETRTAQLVLNYLSPLTDDVMFEKMAKRKHNRTHSYDFFHQPVKQQEEVSRTISESFGWYEHWPYNIEGIPLWCGIESKLTIHHQIFLLTIVGLAHMTLRFSSTVYNKSLETLQIVVSRYIQFRETVSVSHIRFVRFQEIIVPLNKAYQVYAPVSQCLPTRKHHNNYNKIVKTSSHHTIGIWTFEGTHPKVTIKKINHRKINVLNEQNYNDWIVLIHRLLGDTVIEDSQRVTVTSCHFNIPRSIDSLNDDLIHSEMLDEVIPFTQSVNNIYEM